MSVEYLKNHALLIIIIACGLFEELKGQSCNAQNRMSDEITNHVFDTYKNLVMTNGKHIFNTSSDMAMEKMCEYPSSKYALPYCK